MVILAGSPQYMVPAWVNVMSLRRGGMVCSILSLPDLADMAFFFTLKSYAGCDLQIQVIFPANEAPTEELISSLEQLGATCASMPKSLDAFIARATGEADAPMAGFMLKVAAIILSTFQEVFSHILE